MSAHWRSRPEGGGKVAIWLIRAAALYGGRGLAMVLLWPVTFYFLCRRGPERRASRDFLTRVFQRVPTFAEVFKHLRYFGITQLDRIFLLAHGERDFAIDVEGIPLLEHYLSKNQGLLLIGSHQGSFEALRVLSARRPDLKLRVVLDKQKTPAMTRLLEELAPHVGACVIDASRGGTSITLAAAEACQQGAMVALLADRASESESLRYLPFLGESAGFPVGPWLLANALKAPVVLCFGMYLGGNRYRLTFERFAEAIDVPRDRRGPELDRIIARYAARMEHYALAQPYNWFNFHDFWHGVPAPRVMPVCVEPEHADA